MAREELARTADRQARVGPPVAWHAREKHPDRAIRDLDGDARTEGELEHVGPQRLGVTPEHRVGGREDLLHASGQELGTRAVAFVLEESAMHGPQRRADLRHRGRKGRQRDVERAPERRGSEQAEEHLDPLVVDEGVDQDLQQARQPGGRDALEIDPAHDLRERLRRFRP